MFPDDWLAGGSLAGHGRAEQRFQREVFAKQLVGLHDVVTGSPVNRIGPSFLVLLPSLKPIKESRN